jgi:hypothetical protein
MPGRFAGRTVRQHVPKMASRGPAGRGGRLRQAYQGLTLRNIHNLLRDSLSRLDWPLPTWAPAAQGPVRAPRGPPRLGLLFQLEEAAMSRTVFVALAVTTALGILGAATTSWSKGSGGVHPCDLSGVNPVRHKAIFNHPDVAKSYGFEKGSDGTWHVMENCQATGPK